ncbi:MAG TPA: helix-turn-helix domain-containing protein [Candidatus Paceibacterota bacterium]|nr:helix-turn-helix domain-containing protein [Candidatus Paceibacterota bacterium]
MSAKYITLQEASSGTPYDANYLGLLVRKRKLPAKKVKGRWMTTEEDVRAYLRTHSRVPMSAHFLFRRGVLTLSFLSLCALVVAIFFPVFFFWGFEGKGDSGSVKSVATVQKIPDSDGEGPIIIGMDTSGGLSSRMIAATQNTP